MSTRSTTHEAADEYCARTAKKTSQRSYWVFAWDNRDGDCFNSQEEGKQYPSADDAIRAARRWANENGIRVVEILIEEFALTEDGGYWSHDDVQFTSIPPRSA